VATPAQKSDDDWKLVLVGSLGSVSDKGATATLVRGGGGGIILGDVKNVSLGTLTTRLELSSIKDEIIFRLPLIFRTAVVVALGSGPTTGQ
jgi:hypothetical protein